MSAPGDPARQKLADVLRLLTDAGGRMIDTSPMYGRAEAVTGDLVAESGLRARVFLATKVWTSGREAGSRRCGARPNCCAARSSI